MEKPYPAGGHALRRGNYIVKLKYSLLRKRYMNRTFVKKI